MAAIKGNGGRAKKTTAAAKPAKTPGPKSKHRPTTRPEREARKGKPVGGPKFVPNADQVQIVTLMAGIGYTAEQIRAHIINPQTGKPISVDTLEKVFATILATAADKLTAAVAGNLYTIATSPTHKSAPTAAIFWLKSRARWREPEPEWSESRRLTAEAKATLPDGEELVVTMVLEEPKPPAEPTGEAG
jgi:hypothetical protein